MSLALEIFGCLMATMFFAVLLRAPRSTMVYAAFISIVGYLVYLKLEQDVTAFFVSALIIGLLCEIVARIKKMATTLFLVCGIIPLVPGLGLYRAVMFMTEKNYDLASRTAIDALAGIGAIALAITISTMIFSNIPSRWFQRKGENNAPAHHQ